MANQQNESKVNLQVIDLESKRREAKSQNEGPTLSRHLKLRLEIENMKVMLSTGLLSVVALATLANSQLFSSQSPSFDLASTSVPGPGQRGIASVSTGTSASEDHLIHQLAQKNLLDMKAIGRSPSSLEKLSLEYLEGKYTVRLDKGKVKGLEFTNAAMVSSHEVSQMDRPKQIENKREFLERYRSLLPVNFKKTIKVNRFENAQSVVSEVYQLMDEKDRPVANVEFKSDKLGRLLAMDVRTLSSVSK